MAGSSSSSVSTGTSLAFSKECVPPTLLIPPYSLTGPDPEPPPEPIIEPQFIIPPLPPPIDIGCWPLSMYASGTQTNTQSVGSVSAEISYQDEDPCLPEINLDIYFPCPITSGTANAAVEYLAVGEDPSASVSLGTGDNCDLQLSLDLWLPSISIDYSAVASAVGCPVEISASTYYSIPSLLTDRDLRASISLLSFYHPPADDCELELRMDIQFPHVCPPSFSMSGDVGTNWSLRSGDMWVSLRKWNPDLEIYDEGPDTGHDSCDFKLEYGIDFPCAVSATGEWGEFGSNQNPTVTVNNWGEGPANILRFDALPSVIDDPWVRINSAGVNTDCMFAMDLGVQLPCTSLSFPGVGALYGDTGKTGFPIMDTLGEPLGAFYMSMIGNTNGDRQCIAQMTGSAVLDCAGGSGDGIEGFAKITYKAGATPPYTYTADILQVDPDWSVFGLSTTFTSGHGALVQNLYNIKEISPSGDGAGPLEVDDIVIYWQLDSTHYFCDVLNYRGVYVG